MLHYEEFLLYVQTDTDTIAIGTDDSSKAYNKDNVLQKLMTGPDDKSALDTLNPTFTVSSTILIG